MMRICEQRADGTEEPDRLARVVDMVNDAVALLNQVMDEIKAERGAQHDDGDASGTPVRDVE